MKVFPTLFATGVMLFGLGATARAFEDQPDFKLNGDAAKGAEKYKLFCVACHGEKGKGDGPAAAALDPKPTDHSNGEYMNKLSDYYVFTIIKEGGPAVGKSVFMASWKAALTDEDVRNVGAYVRTLSKPKE